MNRNQHIVIGVTDKGEEKELAKDLSWGEAKAEVYKPRAGFSSVKAFFPPDPLPKMVNPDPANGLPPKPGPALTKD